MSETLSEYAQAYHLAQRAMADLKAAIVGILASHQGAGLTNAEIGRSLGIYHGHVGHEGHIPRTLLALLAEEGVVEQDEQTRRWHLRKRPTAVRIDSADQDNAESPEGRT